jgi:large subunit ribosomal protein L32
MPNPKRRHSKQRTATRRAHHKLADVEVATCTNCGAPHQFHHACPSCGHYRGRQVIEVAAAKA